MKTVEQHIQDGTYQPCRHADRGTTLDKIEGIACPATITDKNIRKLWDQQIGALCEHGLVTVVDAPELEHAYYCYMKAMECRSVLEKFEDAPAYYKTLKFHEKDLTAEYRRWIHEYERVLYKFGMTPVEASKVRTNVKKDESADDVINGLIGDG